MTKIVGIDFGTSNVRIAQWDGDVETESQSCEITDAGDTHVMPAVIAFQRTQDGNVQTLVGDNADVLDDEEDVQVVVRNVKRWALTRDEYALRHLIWSLPDAELPNWLYLDKETRSIQALGETLTFGEAIRMILREAISKAGLEGSVAEWRAGTPVSGDLAYRQELVSALDELGCGGKVTWITEEPILPFAFGDALGAVQDGSFLVYDMGGGSFDCAVVQKIGDDLTVFAQDDLPTLGGMDIDDRLKAMKGYNGSVRDLRDAKEQLYSGGSTESVNITDDGVYTLSRDDVEEALVKGEFMRQTLMSMLNAYKKAKLLWKRPADDDEDAPVYGELLASSKAVWSLNVQDMADDIDYVLVVGGPTRIPYFAEQLRLIFGEDKIITANDLALAGGRSDIDNAALTAVSHGACYMFGGENENRYIPLTVDRIPARMTLSVTDGNATVQDSYEPFDRLVATKPVAPYVGEMLYRRAVNEGESSTLNPAPDSFYTVLIEDADGNRIEEYGPFEMRMPRDGYTGPRADRVRLIVDRLGSVWVELGAGFTHVPKPSSDIVSIVRHPIWQTEAQRNVIDELHERQRRYEERQAEITQRNAVDNPFGYGVRSG